MREPLARSRPGSMAPLPARLGALLSTMVLLVALGVVVGGWLLGLAVPQAWTLFGAEGRLVWIGMLVVYVIAMALPFVPGIEIGLALMLLLGVDGIVLVYAGTQLALAISFLCGRLLPRAQWVRLIEVLRPGGSKVLLDCIDAPRPAERMACLAARPGARWLRRVLQRRGLALALLLNMPGNALIGGAGGIAMVAGTSRLFSFARFCLLTALATSPLPVMLLWSGMS